MRALCISQEQTFYCGGWDWYLQFSYCNQMVSRLHMDYHYIVYRTTWTEFRDDQLSISHHKMSYAILMSLLLYVTLIIRQDIPSPERNGEISKKKSDMIMQRCNGRENNYSPSVFYTGTIIMQKRQDVYFGGFLRASIHLPCYESMSLLVLCFYGQIVHW